MRALSFIYISKIKKIIGKLAIEIKKWSNRENNKNIINGKEKSNEFSLNQIHFNKRKIL